MPLEERVMDASKSIEPVENVLRLIYDGTASETGDAFFEALVRATALAMRANWAFVSEFAGSRDRVRTIAFWDSDGFGENFEYDLDGTVCEGVLQGAVRYYPSGVAQEFPREPALSKMGVESYLATPMTTPEGEVLGHLAVFDRKPMNYAQRELDVFKVFGARAAAELARKRAQEALAAGERRLANILTPPKKRRPEDRRLLRCLICRIYAIFLVLANPANPIRPVPKSQNAAGIGTAEKCNANEKSVVPLTASSLKALAPMLALAVKV